MDKKNTEGVIALLWISSGLLTAGIADLTFLQGLSALLVWPYYLGELLKEWVFISGALRLGCIGA